MPHICTKYIHATGECDDCGKPMLGAWVYLKGEHRLGQYRSYYMPREDGMALIYWQSVKTVGGKFKPIEPFYSLVPVSKLYDTVSV